MEGFRLVAAWRCAAEDLKRLGLRGGGERVVGDVRRGAALLSGGREEASVSTSPPSPRSAISAQVSTLLSLVARLPRLRRRCASSAMTANRLSTRPPSSSATKGNVCSVTTDGACRVQRSSQELRFRTRAGLLDGLGVDRGDDPASLLICFSASCNWASRTLRSVTTMTVSKTFSSATCSRASRCAVHAMVLVFPPRSAG